MKAPRKLFRPEQALLAGVCAALAACTGWNVWALRAVLVVLLIVSAPLVIVGYLMAAVLVGLFLQPGARRADDEQRLKAESLQRRQQRMDALEQKIRAAERR